MQVTAYPLSHGGVESTAFLIESGDDALLCFGDTGPDEIEKSTAIADVWTAVAALAKQKRLKAIIIEVSYDNTQPDKLLFGHLTPAWLQKSLAGLETLAGANSLQDLPVVISHIKYSLKKGRAAAAADTGRTGGRPHARCSLHHSGAGGGLAFLTPMGQWA